MQASQGPPLASKCRLSPVRPHPLDSDTSGRALATGRVFPPRPSTGMALFVDVPAVSLVVGVVGAIVAGVDLHAVTVRACWGSAPHTPWTSTSGTGPDTRDHDCRSREASKHGKPCKPPELSPPARVYFVTVAEEGNADRGGAAAVPLPDRGVPGPERAGTSTESAVVRTAQGERVHADPVGEAAARPGTHPAAARAGPGGGERRRRGDVRAAAARLLSHARADHAAAPAVRVRRTVPPDHHRLRGTHPGRPAAAHARREAGSLGALRRWRSCTGSQPRRWRASGSCPQPTAHDGVIAGRWVA